MSTTGVRQDEMSGTVDLTSVDMKVEVIVIPVADVDRAKAFYESLGWRLDADFATGEDFRVVQFTPTGSLASVIFGTGLTAATPGSVDALVLAVKDVEEARAELAGRGVDVTDVQDFPWGRFVFFSDPDGNAWSVQEIQRPGGSPAA